MSPQEFRSIFFCWSSGSFCPGLGWDAILKQKSQTEIWNKRFFETNPDWITQKVRIVTISWYIMNGTIWIILFDKRNPSLRGQQGDLCHVEGQETENVSHQFWRNFKELSAKQSSVVGRVEVPGVLNLKTLGCRLRLAEVLPPTPGTAPSPPLGRYWSNANLTVWVRNPWEWELICAFDYSNFYRQL